MSEPTKTPKWQNFEQLVEDCDTLIERGDPFTAMIVSRALTYIYWQRQIIEEVKSDMMTIQSTLRDMMRGQ